MLRKDTEIKLNKLNKREVNFILRIIKHIYGKQILTPNNRDYLIAQLQDKKIDDDLTMNLISCSKISLVNEEHLNWFEKDLRAALWVFENASKFFLFTAYSLEELTASSQSVICIEDFIVSIDFNHVLQQTHPQPTPISGYQPTPISGYQPTPISGYQPTPISGYQPTPISGYQPTPISGYQPTPISGYQPTPTSGYQPAPTSGYQPFKDRINQLDFQTSIKTEKLQLLKRIYKKNMMSFKEVKWLDENNEEQIYWAEEYLQKHNLLLNPPFFIAGSIQEKYQQILATFDFLALSQNPNLYLYPSLDKLQQLKQIEQMNLKLSATIFLDRMKKAWSQKKFRDKADKKSAFEILFSNKTKKQLRAYAEESNKDVISFLNMIIDEKLKEKRMEIIKADEE